MWLTRFLVCASLMSVVASAQMASHPRIWLTPTLISSLQAKKAASATDWSTVLTAANALLTKVPPTITIVAATNSNPVQFTVAEASLPWSQAGMEIAITGATGNWSALNNGTAYHGWTMTITGTQTFTVPIDSTAFGTFAGQSLNTWLGHSNSDATFKSGFFSWGYRGDKIYDNVHQLGLVYAVKKADGDADWTTYRDKAKEFYNHFAALGPAGIAMPIAPTNCYDSRFTLAGLAMLHDWLWNDLSPTERSNGAATLHLWASTVETTGYTATPTGPGAIVEGFPRSRSISNFWGGHVLGVGLAGYAMYDESALNGQAAIDWARGQWDTYLAPELISPGGMVASSFWWESMQYGGNHFSRLMKYALAVKTSTGEDLLTADQLKQWAAALPHMRRPDRWSTDQQSTNSALASVGVMTRQELLLLAHLLHGTPEGEMVQYMTRNFGTVPSGSNNVGTLDYQWYDRLLWEDSRSGTDYTTLPTSAFLPGANLLVSRSDWTDNAVYMTFRASTNSNSDHSARTAGNVEIQRGPDRLLGNIHNQDGSGGSTSHSAESSTLLWSDDNSYDGLPSTGNYLGGQKWWGFYTPIVASKTASAYAYALANLTEMYNNSAGGTPIFGAPPNPATRTMRYFFRSVLDFQDGLLVVWDRVKASQSSFTKTQRWHTFSTFSMVDASTRKATIGNSALFIRSVLPISPTLSVAQNGSTSTYRLDISDAFPSTDFNALTILYAAASSGSMPGVTRLTNIDTHFVGVQVESSSPKVAIMAIPVTNNGNNTYTPTSYTSCTFFTSHSGPARYVLAGLQPAAYTIARIGAAPVTGQPVGADGTLTFTGAPGMYAVYRDGDPSPFQARFNGMGMRGIAIH